MESYECRIGQFISSRYTLWHNQLQKQLFILIIPKHDDPKLSFLAWHSLWEIQYFVRKASSGKSSFDSLHACDFGQQLLPFCDLLSLLLLMILAISEAFLYFLSHNKIVPRLLGGTSPDSRSDSDKFCCLQSAEFLILNLEYIVIGSDIS